MRPNIVVVLADDMGWGDLGCYGAEAIPTPNIDSLAAEGVRCTDAHSSSAVCSPSRYSLITGRYAWRGPLKNGVLGGHGPALIERDRPTIASSLHDAGYATAAVGKWHLGVQWQWRDGRSYDASDPDVQMWLPKEIDAGFDVDYSKPFTGGPLDLGFERFFGIAGSLDMPPYCFLDQDRTAGIPDREKEVYSPGQRLGLQTTGWRDDQVDIRFTEEATTWLRQRPDDGRPFFLYVAPAAPHRPCVPPEFVRGRSTAGRRGDSVCLVDWMVGELMSALHDIGTADNTLVLISSDNGAPLIFPEDGDVVTHRPNGPWRGQKADIWDGGHREPLIARWPGQLPAGVVLDDLICLTDVFRTVAAATGATVPDGAAEDSLDVLPALRGEGSVTEDRVVVHHSVSGRFAVRDGQWKAAFCTGSGGGFSQPKGVEWTPEDPAGQLYDMTTDPAETTNLWDSRPDVVADLSRRLATVTAGEPTAPAL